MKKLLLTAALAATMVTATAFAQQGPVKQDPASNPEKTTVFDCLVILNGLNEIDGKHDVVINAGKPNEQIAQLVYEFGNGRLRQDLARNITILTAIQRANDDTRQKIFAEVAKGAAEIKPGTPESTNYDSQMKQLTSAPCPIDNLVRIKTSDLKLDKNEIRAAALSAIDRILDR